MKVIQFFKFALYEHKDILSKINVHILRKAVTLQVFKRQLMTHGGGGGGGGRNFGGGVHCWDHVELQLCYPSLGHIPKIPLLSQTKLLKTS